MLNNNDFFLLNEIVKKDFTIKYKGSSIGIFWSVLKPLLIMILLTMIFSTLFSNKIENYPVYFLSGKCIYDFFSFATNYSTRVIKNNKNILKSTSAPKHIFVLGSVISEFINFLITIIILIVVMIVTDSTFHPTIPLAIIPIISLLMTIIGIGLILSLVCIYYTDIEHLWGVITMLTMYASAIFYPMDIIPQPYHNIMVLNPIFWIIDQFRSLAIYGIVPNTLYIINSLLISSIILVFGIIIFKKFEQKVAMKF